MACSIRWSGQKIRINEFDVCMTVSAVEAGASVALAACENLPTQQFSLQENGNLVAKENPALCITTSAPEKKEGRGATPVHVMRPITLETCNEENAAYQVWSKFSM